VVNQGKGGVGLWVAKDIHEALDMADVLLLRLCLYFCLVAFSSWLFFICVNFLVTLGIGPIYEGGIWGRLMRHTNVVFGYICSYAFCPFGALAIRCTETQ